MSVPAAGVPASARWSGLPRQRRTDGPEYELRSVVLPRGMSRSAARQLLAEQAERDGWELSRLALFRDGTRRVTLRRKIIRARLTLGGLTSAS
jgi:hypothetical protein